MEYTSIKTFPYSSFFFTSGTWTPCPQCTESVLAYAETGNRIRPLSWSICNWQEAVLPESQRDLKRTNTGSVRLKATVNTDSHVGNRAALSSCGENGMLFLRSFPPKTYNPSVIRRKTSDKPSLRTILQNIWPGLLRTIKVIRNKGSKRNHQGLEEPKGT